MDGLNASFEILLLESEDEVYTFGVVNQVVMPIVWDSNNEDEDDYKIVNVAEQQEY